MRTKLIATGAAFLLLLMAGCSSPVADSVGLAGQEIKRGVVGYEKVTYQYPVQVPGSNRFVYIVSEEPINRPVTYEDYLAWKAGKPILDASPKTDEGK